MADDGCIKVLVANPRSLEYIAGMDKLDLLLLNLKDVSVAMYIWAAIIMIPLF